MTTSGFTITGQRELNLRLKAIGQAPKEMLRDVGVHAVAQAKILVPRQTGNLGRTIRVGSLTDTAVEVRAGGTAQVGYAAAVEFGSRAHQIVPVRRKALAWGGARTLGGRLRAGARATNFATRVNHPGSRAKPYLIPGLEKAIKFVGLDKIVKAWNAAS